MQTPLEIAFLDIDPSDEVKSLVEQEAAELERLHKGIASFHVYILAPDPSQPPGNICEVTIEVRVPGNELVVRGVQGTASGNEHLRMAVRNAFATMATRLNEWRAQIGVRLQGLVLEIHHDQDFGQIIASDGRLVYFHRNSVVDGSFHELQPRDAVELIVQTDERQTRLQASTVRSSGPLEYHPTRKPSRR